MSDQPYAIQLALDQQNLAVERQKLFIEYGKLRLEASKTWWSAAGAIVPVLVVCLTIAYGAWALQRNTRLQFETKVVESIIQSPGPYEAYARAQMIADLNASELPSELRRKLAAFRPERFGNPPDPGEEAKREFVRLLATYPNRRDAIIADWRIAFPGDTWVEAFRSAPRHTLKAASRSARAFGR